MKPKEFFDLVADMRKAQKEYFKTPASAYKVKQERGNQRVNNQRFQGRA